MKASDLQYMRAIMKDPRKEGTKAHKEEMEAFRKFRGAFSKIHCKIVVDTGARNCPKFEGAMPASL